MKPSTVAQSIADPAAIGDAATSATAASRADAPIQSAGAAVPGSMRRRSGSARAPSEPARWISWSRAAGVSQATQAASTERDAAAAAGTLTLADRATRHTA